MGEGLEGAARAALSRPCQLPSALGPMKMKRKSIERQCPAASGFIYQNSARNVFLLFERQDVSGQWTHNQTECPPPVTNGSITEAVSHLIHVTATQVPPGGT
jgi:hypothetical protein